MFRLFPEMPSRPSGRPDFKISLPGKKSSVIDDWMSVIFSSAEVIHRIADKQINYRNYLLKMRINRQLTAFANFCLFFTKSFKRNKIIFICSPFHSKYLS